MRRDGCLAAEIRDNENSKRNKTPGAHVADGSREKSGDGVGGGITGRLRGLGT